MRQCPSCNRVWVPDGTHPDGGVWKREKEQIAGADRDYCFDCMAKREAEVASLSHDIEEVVEKQEVARVAPVPVFDEGGPRVWLRPVVVAGVVLVVIGGAIAARTMYRGVTSDMPSVTEEERVVGPTVRPAVGGSWETSGTSGSPSSTQPRAAATRPGRPLPSGGQIDPDLRALLRDADRGGATTTPARSARTGAAPTNSTTPRRPDNGAGSGNSGRATGAASFTSTSGSPQDGEATPSEGDTEDQSPQGTEPQPDQPTDEPPGDEPPPDIFLPPGIPPPDELPDIPRIPDEIVIPIPPPDER